MFRFAIVVLVLVLFVPVGPARAAAPEGGLTVGVGVPSGDFADIADPGFVLQGWFGAPVSSSMTITGTGGFSIFSLTDGVESQIGEIESDFTTTVFNVRVGLQKYWGAKQRFYTGPSLGLYFANIEVDTPGLGTFDSGTETQFGFGPRVGYLLPVGEYAIDLAVEYHTVFSNIEDQGGDDILVNWFGLSAGLAFGHSN